MWGAQAGVGRGSHPLCPSLVCDWDVVWTLGASSSSIKGERDTHVPGPPNAPVWEGSGSRAWALRAEVCASEDLQLAALGSNHGKVPVKTGLWAEPSRVRKPWRGGCPGERGCSFSVRSGESS